MTDITAKLDQLVLLAATRAPGSQALADVVMLAREVQANPDLAAEPKLEGVIRRATRQLEAGATELDLSPRPNIGGEMRAEMRRRLLG